MMRSSLIEGGVVLRMSVPTTKCVGDNVGIAGNVKCAQFKIVERGVKPQVPQTRLNERHARTASVVG